MYIYIITTNWSQKTEKKRVWWTVDRDRISYDGPLITSTPDITTAKLYLNHTVITSGEKYNVIAINDFYLGTLMAEYKYVHIPLLKIL